MTPEQVVYGRLALERAHQDLQLLNAAIHQMHPLDMRRAVANKIDEIQQDLQRLHILLAEKGVTDGRKIVGLIIQDMLDMPERDSTRDEDFVTNQDELRLVLERHIRGIE